MKVNREKLVAELESVSPGLANREIVEQSNCFIFKDGTLLTYNDEIACRRPSLLTDITGAVPVEFLTLLTKLPDELVTILEKEGELRVQGAKRSAGIRMDSEILIPLDALDDPDDWEELDPEFGEAVEMVRQCTSKSDELLELTCVHLTPEFVEASDNYQISRFTIETPIDDAVLVRNEAIKNITAIGADEISCTESWVHFRNEDDLIVSCRTRSEDYRDYDQYYGKKGETLEFPQSVTDIADRAGTFAEDDLLEINLQAGRVRLKATNKLGWFKESGSIKYNGPEMRFCMTKALLDTVTTKYDHCQVNSEKKLLMVNRGRFEYVTTLMDQKNGKEK